MKDIYIQDTEALYRDFKKIPEQSFREKIRYVDNHKEQIDQLSFSNWIEINLDYTFALFEVGYYERFLEKADVMIEQVIINNIYFHQHKDVYCELLFRKAASLYNIGEIDKTIVIIDQIISIDHSHKFAPAFLQKCLNHKKRYARSWAQALGIAFLLVGVGIMALKVLVIKPFLPENISFANSVQSALLTSGIAFLIFTEVYNLLWAKILVAEKVRRSYKRKKEKQ